MVANKCDRWDYQFVKENRAACLVTAFRAVREKLLFSKEEADFNAEFSQYYDWIVNNPGTVAKVKNPLGLISVNGDKTLEQYIYNALNYGFNAIELVDIGLHEGIAPSAEPQRGDRYYTNDNFYQYLESGLTGNALSWLSAKDTLIDDTVVKAADGRIPTALRRRHGFGIVTVIGDRGIGFGNGFDVRPLNRIKAVDGYSESAAAEKNSGLAFIHKKILNASTGKLYKVIKAPWDGATYEEQPGHYAGKLNFDDGGNDAILENELVAKANNGDLLPGMLATLDLSDFALSGEDIYYVILVQGFRRDENDIVIEVFWDFSDAIGIERKPTASDGQESFILFHDNKISLDGDNHCIYHTTNKQFNYRGHIDNLPKVADPAKRADGADISNVFFACTYGDYTSEQIAELERVPFGPSASVKRVPYSDRIGTYFGKHFTSSPAFDVCALLVYISWKLPFLAAELSELIFENCAEWGPDTEIEGWNDSFSDAYNSKKAIGSSWTGRFCDEGSRWGDFAPEGKEDDVSPGSMRYKTVDLRIPPASGGLGAGLSEEFFIFMRRNNSSAPKPGAIDFYLRSPFPNIPLRETRYQIGKFSAGDIYDTTPIIEPQFSGGGDGIWVCQQDVSFTCYRKINGWQFS